MSARFDWWVELRRAAAEVSDARERARGVVEQVLEHREPGTPMALTDDQRDALIELTLAEERLAAVQRRASGRRREA